MPGGARYLAGGKGELAAQLVWQPACQIAPRWGWAARGGTDRATLISFKKRRSLNCECLPPLTTAAENRSQAMSETSATPVPVARYGSVSCSPVWQLASSPKAEARSPETQLRGRYLSARVQPLPVAFDFGFASGFDFRVSAFPRTSGIPAGDRDAPVLRSQRTVGCVTKLPAQDSRPQMKSPALLERGPCSWILNSLAAACRPA
jgi:hypothetical protein